MRPGLSFTPHVPFANDSTINVSFSQFNRPHLAAKIGVEQPRLYPGELYTGELLFDESVKQENSILGYTPNFLEVEMSSDGVMRATQPAAPNSGAAGVVQVPAAPASPAN